MTLSITPGASSGIGAATALHFASLGSDLALVGRNLANLEAIRKQIADAGHTVKVALIVADLSKEGDTISAVNKTVEAFGKLDVLVNSAGILTRGTTENTTLQAYDELMNVNLRSVFHLMQLSIPHLRQTKGAIVNVSSVTGLRAVSGLSYYAVIGG
jgi:short-subunit dehydrogenase